MKQSSGSIAFSRKTWLVAASLFLFVSVATFAYFNFIVPKQKSSVVSNGIPGNVPPELPEDFKVKIQQYELSGAHDLQLTTEAGLKMGFPAGSIIDARGTVYLGKYQMEIIEVTDAQQIGNIISLEKNRLARLPDQLIYIGLQEAGLNFNRLNPPGLINDYKVQKAAFDTTGVIMMSLSHLDLPVIKMNQVMQDYQRYQESKKLQDSIETYYSNDGKVYHLKQGKGMTLDKSFVNKVKRFVRNYENSPDFSAKINQAKYCWSLYQKQHQLTINQAGTSLVINRYLLGQGWYALWKE